MIPAFPVYLFDVDGTLVDSAADICGAVQEVLSQFPPDAPVEDSLLRKYIGHHLQTLFNDLFPGADPAKIDSMINEYRRIYPMRQHCSTSLYPGVVDALELLPGLKSTATTKSTQTLNGVLEKFGLRQFFDHVQGTDGFPAKPAPDVIQHALRALGANPSDCLLVGDAGPDMEAGRRAGVKICGVRYGYGDVEEMKQWRPDYWIDDLRQLVPASIEASALAR